MSRWAVVLAGGSGTRFWPLSTPQHPKQFLPLVGEKPLLRQAVNRLSGLIPAERTVVVTGRSLLDTTRELLPEIPSGNLLAEPRPASTGPALTWATATVAARDPGATVLSLHADWYVGDDDAFRQTGLRAMEVAETHDVLVTVGIVPTRPEPAYGYIVPGAELGLGARRVARFTEKPDVGRAAGLVAQGALWNSGLFAWTTDRFLAETLEVASEIGPGLAQLQRGDVAGFFATVTPVAVDVSHYERSRRVAVVQGAFPWDDVGSWAALRRVRSADAAGNVLVGHALQREAAECVAWADDGSIVLDGVQDLVVIRARGVTLVTTPDRAGNLKELLASLPASLRAPEAGGTSGDSGE